MIILRLLRNHLGYLKNTYLLRLLRFTYIAYNKTVLSLLTLLMKLNFDFHFLSSAYGDSDDEPNNMQFEESHPEP